MESAKIIKKMENTVNRNEGFDAIVIVASNGASKYWDWRLSETRKGILSPKTKVVCVEEDWEGGAGQLLGTLYAFSKANKIIDLEGLLKKGATVAIYHTAGYGKRMAPLCGTEGNNKPAIKLPKPLKIGNENTLLTLLEAVLYSTQIFAKSREGRISVFWGDQIIIPSRPVKIETKLPVEIFGIKKEFYLSPSEWKKNWQKYGILIPIKGKGVLQREKLDWKQVKELQGRDYLKPDSEGKLKIAKSMGCFSIDFILLKALLNEFKKEIELKKRKLDTDEHLWMPLTSSRDEYVKMGGSPIYWQRIDKFKKEFQKNTGFNIIVGEKNLGKDTLWWDYGNLASYHKNLLKLLEESNEGKAGRKFYDIEKYFVKEKKSGDTKVKNSILINVQAKGKIKNSIIVNSEIGKIDTERAVIINSKAESVIGRNILLYYVKEEKDIKALPHEVITDIVIGEGTKVRMRTSLLRDSKKDWKICLPQNPFSYREIERCLARLADGAFRFKI